MRVGNIPSSHPSKFQNHPIEPNVPHFPSPQRHANFRDAVTPARRRSNAHNEYSRDIITQIPEGGPSVLTRVGAILRLFCVVLLSSFSDSLAAPASLLPSILPLTELVAL